MCAVYGEAYKNNNYFHGFLPKFKSSLSIQNKFLWYQINYNETYIWIFITYKLSKNNSQKNKLQY